MPRRPFVLYKMGNPILGPGCGLDNSSVFSILTHETRNTPISATLCYDALALSQAPPKAITRLTGAGVFAPGKPPDSSTLDQLR